MRILKFIANFLLNLICFTLLLISILYLFTKIYNFPKFEAFNGDKLYNPYENIADIKPLKCNWHAHTTAWGGITNGHDTNEEIVEAYDSYGYDVIGISNYHFIDDYLKDSDKIYIGIYEHGYNVYKSHKLGLNADKVSFFDYPLYQLPSHKQQIIEILNRNNATTIIAHPKFVNGHNFRDMGMLVNYSLIEVLNHYRISDAYWDVALSAGHPVYVNGSDDTHDIHREATFQRWTMVYSKSREVNDILEAMTTGLAYGVDAPTREQDLYLIKSRSTEKGFVHYFNNPAKLIQVIGQDGKVLKEAKNINQISYELTANDTYARVFAKGDISDLYLNPVFKYSGNEVPTNFSDDLSVNQLLTWLWRLGNFIFILAVLWLWRKIIKW